MKKLILLFLTCFTFASVTVAQDFVYKPLNPAFGGDSFNYNWLLSSAEAQDNTVDPDRIERATAGSTLDNFTESLNRQLLSQLSRSLIGNNFGTDGLEDGSYTIGNFQIEVTSNLEGVVINVFDTTKGEQTEIVIPFY